MKHKNIKVTFTVGEHETERTSGPRTCRLSVNFEPSISLGAFEPKDYKTVQRLMKSVGRLFGRLVEKPPTP